MPDPRTPSRRSVVRGVAWSVPVVSVAATAPAFAASPCQKTALQSVTWSSAYTSTTQTGTTTSGTNVNVTGVYTATRFGPGSINTANNMGPVTAVTTNDAFRLVNNTPTASAMDGNTNYQTVTFGFTRPVFELTFFIDDIDQGTGYQDYVGLTATPAETPTTSPGTAITGGGTNANPWRTNAGSGDNAANQTVKVTYGNGFTGMSSLSLRFWSPLVPITQTQHLVRIRQMQLRTCV